MLAAFKAVTGLAAHSIAVITDAVNNLSDALPSTITIVGMKRAGMPKGKNHPLGYGLSFIFQPESLVSKK